MDIAKYIHKNIKLIDIRNINIVSSVILFIHGIRTYNDIDFNIKYYKQKFIKTKSFKKKLIKLLEFIKNKYNGAGESKIKFYFLLRY